MSIKTTNLGLHLWREEDYVLMDDFNADHAAIDRYVDTAATALEAVERRLLEGQQRTNHNLFELMAPSCFVDGLRWTPRAMVINPLDSAGEAGTCTGFVWKEHPIQLGIYSGGRDAEGKLQPELDILDASMFKTVDLDGEYTHATLLVQAQGWYSRVPPSSGLAYHVEDYTGITVSATLDAIPMAHVEDRATAWPGNGAKLREFCFELEGSFDSMADVKITFHCPANRGLWVYDWALLLA